eukprot:1050884-Rhodomonas_salina.2
MLAGATSPGLSSLRSMQWSAPDLSYPRDAMLTCVSGGCRGESIWMPRWAWGRRPSFLASISTPPEVPADQAARYETELSVFA